jgi:hypothetical protein|tara:strand:+ start:869 stop:1204 length:336 start_codon:yes stop_codon:yes gene_type:complete
MSEESTVKRSLQTVRSVSSFSDLAVGILLDYVTFVEDTLENMLEDCEVFFVFPPIEDLKARGVGSEHTIKLMIDDVLLVSCCGTDPEVIVYNLFCWAEDMFDVHSFSYGDA